MHAVKDLGLSSRYIQGVLHYTRNQNEVTKRIAAITQSKKHEEHSRSRGGQLDCLLQEYTAGLLGKAGLMQGKSSCTGRCSTHWD